MNPLHTYSDSTFIKTNDNKYTTNFHPNKEPFTCLLTNLQSIS